MLRVESIGISSEGNGAIEEEMPLLAKKSNQGSVVGWVPLETGKDLAFPFYCCEKPSMKEASCVGSAAFG